MIDRHPSIDPVHPGKILREDVLPALDMSKTAVALGISRQTLYDILNEKQPVTAEMAVRFGKLFGNGSGFWVNLQRNYDLIAELIQNDVDQNATRTIISFEQDRTVCEGRNCAAGDHRTNPGRAPCSVGSTVLGPYSVLPRSLESRGSGAPETYAPPPISISSR